MNQVIRPRHEFFMREALREAEQAGKSGNLAIGAVLVWNGKIVARGQNRRTTNNSKVAHAENMMMLQNAEFLREHSWECTLYSTLEPCFMCISTAIVADVGKFVFGATDNLVDIKGILKHAPYLSSRIKSYVPGILKRECENVLKCYNEKFSEYIFAKQANG